MKRSSKALLVLVSLVLVLGMFAGCSKTPPSYTGEKVTLQFVRWSNGPALDAEEEDKIARFNASHPSIQVEMTLLPWDETFKKVELSMATDDPIDLFYWDTPAYNMYKKGMFKNLQPFFDRDLNMSDYDKNLFEPLKFDKENMYIAPENLQTIALYYNKNLFDAAGLDYPDENTTWEELRDMAKTLTKKDGDTFTQFGFDIATLNTWWAWQSLVFSQGGELVDSVNEPTAIKLNTPETVSSLQFLQDLIYKDQVSPTNAQRDALGGGFFTGKVGMYVGGDWDLGGLKEIEDFEWGMAPLPKWGNKRVTPYFVGGYVMTEKTKYPEQAWEFLRWVMTDNQETLAKQQSWIPVSKSARKNATLPDWAPEGYEAARYEWTKYGVIGDIYHIKWREAHDKYIAPMQDEIFLNNDSVEDAVKKAEEEINAIFK